MKRLKILELQVGMVVAEDIFGRSGEVVMPTGAQLTEKNIKLLEGWGITSVSVEGEGEDITKKFSAEQITETEKEITQRFAPSAKENPFIGQLIKLCIHRRLMQKFSPTPAPSPAPTPAPATAANPQPSTPQPETPQTT